MAKTIKKRRLLKKRKSFHNLFDRLMYEQGHFNKDAATKIHKTAPTISRYRGTAKDYCVPGQLEQEVLAKFVGYTGELKKLFKKTRVRK